MTQELMQRLGQSEADPVYLAILETLHVGAPGLSAMTRQVLAAACARKVAIINRASGGAS